MSALGTLLRKVFYTSGGVALKESRDIRPGTGIEFSYDTTNKAVIVEATGGFPGGGDVTGPAGGTADNEIALFSSTTGKVIKTSGVAITAIPVGNLAQGGATSGQVITWDGANWAPAAPSGGGSGDVVGPAGGVVDGEFTLYNGTTGKLIKGSSYTLATLPFLPISGGSVSGDVNFLGNNITNATLGTGCSVPLARISQGGAATNNFMSWNGSTWAPVAFTLSLLPQGGASTGQYLAWSGSAWAPTSFTEVTATSYSADLVPDNSTYDSTLAATTSIDVDLTLSAGLGYNVRFFLEADNAGTPEVKEIVLNAALDGVGNASIRSQSTTLDTTSGVTLTATAVAASTTLRFTINNTTGSSVKYTYLRGVETYTLPVI